MTSTWEKKQSRKTVLEETQTVDLVTQNFHSAILNTLKGPKETMPKNLKESVRMMSHQRQNIN